MRPPWGLLQYPFASHLSNTVAVHLGRLLGPLLSSGLLDSTGESFLPFDATLDDESRFAFAAHRFVDEFFQCTWKARVDLSSFGEQVLQARTLLHLRNPIEKP